MESPSVEQQKKIGLRFENVQYSSTFQEIVSTLALSEKKVLDIGCGYGEYLAHFGDESVGITTTDEEVAYAKNKGLSVIYGNAENINTLDLPSPFDAFWMNNLFEHLLSPHSFLMKLKLVAKTDSLLILGVPVVPKPLVLLSLTKFRGVMASNHINFFTKETLRYTVERAGWEVVAMRSFFFKNRLLDRISLSLAPHIYIVARNNSTFTYPPKKLKEWVDDPMYQPLLNITSQHDRK